MHPGHSAILDEDYFKRVIQDQYREVSRRARSLDLLVTVGRQKIQVAFRLCLGLLRGVAPGHKGRGFAALQAVFPSEEIIQTLTTKSVGGAQAHRVRRQAFLGKERRLVGLFTLGGQFGQKRRGIGFRSSSAPRKPDPRRSPRKTALLVKNKALAVA